MEDSNNSNEPPSSVKLRKGKLVTVMISNIPKGKNNYTLDKFFKNKGVICWGCRANFTAQIAFIDVEVQDCEKVLCLHAQEWDGCELQVKMDDTPSRKKRKNTEAVEKRSPTFEKQERDERTLCFKNISHQIFASQAESLYRGVKAVHLARNTRNNKPTGIAFVEFFTKEEMIEAYGSKNKINLNGRTVYVSLCAPLTITTKSKENSKVLEDDKLTSPVTEDSELKEKTSKRQRKAERSKTRTIMISNFPTGSNQSSITKFFKTQKIPIYGCRANFASRVAFVDIEEKDGERTLKLDKEKWDGCVLSVEVDKSKKAQKLRPDFLSEAKCDAAERTICVKNVPLGTFAQALEALFKDVKEVRHLHDFGGQPTGIAYVEFFTKSSMKTALAKEEGYQLQGRHLDLVDCGKDSTSTLYSHSVASIKEITPSKFLSKKKLKQSLKKRKSGALNSEKNKSKKIK